MKRLICYFLSLFGMLYSVEDLPQLDSTLEFHLTMDPLHRLFHILRSEDDKCLGMAVSSSYGQIDFYNTVNEEKWVNQFDHLFDAQGTPIALVRLESDILNNKSSKIGLFYNEDELLAVFNEEKYNFYTFRDEKKELLATINLNALPLSIGFLGFSRNVKDWSITIVNQEKLKEKNVPHIFLAWTVLKHQQKYLPGPLDLPYVSDVPKF